VDFAVPTSAAVTTRRNTSKFAHAGRRTPPHWKHYDNATGMCVLNSTASATSPTSANDRRLLPSYSNSNNGTRTPHLRPSLIRQASSGIDYAPFAKEAASPASAASQDALPAKLLGQGSRTIGVNGVVLKPMLDFHAPRNEANASKGTLKACQPCRRRMRK
jgi:hypothetical protein